MSIGEIARTDVVTVDPETALPDVARVMRDERVGSVVVVDEKGSLAGMVTDRDVVTFGLTRDVDPRTLVANDILAPHVFAVEGGESVSGVFRRMREEGVRRVPLVEDGELRGIVTLDDLVVHLADELSDLAAVIRGESPP